LTKADIAEVIYQAHGGLSKKEAGDVVERIFGILKENLTKGVDIRISRFGSFISVNKRERIGRNPQTGEKIVIRPRRVINFKPARRFIDRLNS